jgi:hypothetical protein
LPVTVVADDGNEDGHIKREAGGVVWSGGGTKKTGEPWRLAGVVEGREEGRGLLALISLKGRCWL